MKRLVCILLMTLMCTFVYAQRGGSSSRGSSPSRTTSSVSSSRGSSPSRSTATYNSRSSYSAPSRSSSSVSTRTSSPRQSYSPTRNSQNMSRSSSPSRSTVGTSSRIHSNGTNVRTENARPTGRPATTGRPAVNSTHNSGPRPQYHANYPHHGGHPHHVPHGMHPTPPHHHPFHHHHHYHFHYVPCYNWYYANLYWIGYWEYVHMRSYDQVIVYVNETHKTNLIAMGVDDFYIYSIIEENSDRYLTITDKNDQMLVKYPVGRKYVKVFIDEDGCWITKKNDRDPILFKYIDGQLYSYES